MKTYIKTVVQLTFLMLTTSIFAQDARELITKVVNANGGVQALHKLKDVSFDYTFKVSDKDIVDISKERYICKYQSTFKDEKVCCRGGVYVVSETANQ